MHKRRWHQTTWLYVSVLMGFSLPLSANYIGTPLAVLLPKDGPLSPYEAFLQTRWGYQGDWVLYQGLQHAQSLSWQGQFGTIGCCLSHRFQIQTIVGVVDAECLQASDTLLYMRATGNWAGGVGVQVLLLQHARHVFSATAGVFRALPRISLMKVNGHRTNTWPHTLKIEQWQTAVGYAYHGEVLAPWIGIFGGDTRVYGFGMMSSSLHKAGVYMGCSLLPGYMITFDVEARVIVENGISLAARAVF